MCLSSKKSSRSMCVRMAIGIVCTYGMATGVVRTMVLSYGCTNSQIRTGFLLFCYGRKN